MYLRRQGVALLASLLFLLVTAGVLTLMFSSTLSELRSNKDDLLIVQTLALARGGASLGGRILNDSVKDELSALIKSNASTVNKWPFGNNTDLAAAEPLPNTVIADLSVLATNLQTFVDGELCGASKKVSPSSGIGEISLRLYFTDTACGTEPLPKGVKLPANRFVSSTTDTYAIPYILVSEASLNQYTRNIVIQGEYQFKIGSSKLAKYALFTDEHISPKGEDLWFTDLSLIDGPVHTNQSLNLAFTPWFGDVVTSAGCTNSNGLSCREYGKRGARFYTAGFVSASELGSTPSYGSTTPEFTAGVDWEADYVPLPSNDFDQLKEAKAGGLFIDSTSGLTGDSLYSLKLFAGDASELPPTSDGMGGWTTDPAYQYIELCYSSTSCETYRYTDGGPLEKKAGSVWSTVAPSFNGVLYIDGDVERFTGPSRTTPSDPSSTTPALASFAQMTVVPKKSIRITGDITYASPPCDGYPQRISGAVVPATCDDLGAKNVLGVFSANDDILVGNGNSDPSLNSPDNLRTHGVFLTSSGVTQVENPFSDAARGNWDFLGGIIQKKQGATGYFASSTGGLKHGYARRMTYDKRMSLGVAPPFFPGTSPNTLQGVFVYSYGQREQVY